MIIAGIGCSLLLGLVLGWYGYKAHLRIARWGEALTELDHEARLEHPECMDGYSEPVAPGEAPVQTGVVKPIPAVH